MIFSAADLREFIVRDTLDYLGEWSAAAENLLVGTAIQESGLGFSLKSGRRLGIYHLSSRTHRAIWDQYLVLHPELASTVRGLAGQHSFVVDPHRELLTNLRYATAIAWCQYRRTDCQLPDAGDIRALGQFWHRHFQRRANGSIDEFVRNYRDLAGEEGRRVA